jgi:hypothetical protein
VPPRLIVLIGGIAFLAFAFPGLMTLDSADQLLEARAGFYTDAHPPAMAALWSVLDRIVAGPFLMLVVQVSTFLAGAYLVLSRAMSPRAAAIAASLVLLFPPIANPMAYIWKDSLMAGTLLLGAGLVMRQSRAAKLAALPCFVLATAVKYNAFAATLPLIVLFFEWTPGQRWLRRHAIAAAVWLGVTAAAVGTNAVLVDQPMHFWHSSLAVSDICAVIANAGPLSDDELRRELAGTGLLVDRDIQAHARRIYESRDMATLVMGEARMWDLPFRGTTPAPAAQREAIARAWWRLVTTYPGAYARGRVHHFLDLLGITYKSQSAVRPRVLRYPHLLDELGLRKHSFKFQNAWSNLHGWLLESTPLFTPWLYVVLATILLAATPWIARGQRDLIAVLASGLIAELSLLPLAVSPDYRYSHWTITATVVAVVIVIYRRAAAARGTAGTRAASPRA